MTYGYACYRRLCTLPQCGPPALALGVAVPGADDVTTVALALAADMSLAFVPVINVEDAPLPFALLLFLLLLSLPLLSTLLSQLLILAAIISLLTLLLRLKLRLRMRLGGPALRYLSVALWLSAMQHGTHMVIAGGVADGCCCFACL